MPSPCHRLTVPSAFGDFTIVWQRGAGGDRVYRVLLPGETGGEPVRFTLGLLDLGQCPPFQRRVLLAEYGIPRGRVSTYGRLAAGLGAPGAARAVGTALARNPFPIIIPCHRTVRADGDPGGFRGGAPPKRGRARRGGGGG